MKILVCGSRDYEDRETLCKVLDRIGIQYRPIEAVIEGEAKGADTFAREWADYYGIPVFKFPADWKKYGKAAGPIRNRLMLDSGCPDLVVAFPKDGNLEASKGTKNMVQQAKERGIKVIIIGGGDEFEQLSL